MEGRQVKASVMGFIREKNRQEMDSRVHSFYLSCLLFSSYCLLSFTFVLGSTRVIPTPRRAL